MCRLRRNYEKTREDTIEALKMVLHSIENSEQISEAKFCSEPEYDESIKNNGVWFTKYPNGWQTLSISLRYKRKVQNGDCSGSGGTSD